MSRIVQSVCGLVVLSTILAKNQDKKNHPMKAAIFGLNSQRAVARAKWGSLGFEEAWLNEVKFGQSVQY